MADQNDERNYDQGRSDYRGQGGSFKPDQRGDRDREQVFDGRQDDYDDQGGAGSGSKSSDSSKSGS